MTFFGSRAIKTVLKPLLKPRGRVRGRRHARARWRLPRIVGAAPPGNNRTLDCRPIRSHPEPPPHPGRTRGQATAPVPGRGRSGVAGRRPGSWRGCRCPRCRAARSGPAPGRRASPPRPAGFPHDRLQGEVIGGGQFQRVPVSAGHPRVLLAGDVEVLEQGLQAIAKAEVAERDERRRGVTGSVPTGAASGPGPRRPTAAAAGRPHPSAARSSATPRPPAGRRSGK